MGPRQVGKSTLMKKIAGQFEDTEDVTVFYCSSDPDSLDAVVLHSSKVVIVDGTARHVFDPKYPGIGETIINLGMPLKLMRIMKRICKANGMMSDPDECFRYMNDLPDRQISIFDL